MPKTPSPHEGMILRALQDRLGDSWATIDAACGVVADAEWCRSTVATYGGDGVTMWHRSTVNHHLVGLERKGWLDKDYHGPRGKVIFRVKPHLASAPYPCINYPEER